jgi:hypothetical protein
MTNLVSEYCDLVERGAVFHNAWLVQPMGPVSAKHRAGAIEAMTKNACNQRSAASDA